jgi:hypothetical protein
MADPSFEHALHRLFQDAPVLPDAGRFAARIEARLEREWTARRILIGLGGAAAGVAAMWQLMGASTLARLVGAVENPTGAVARQTDALRLSLGAVQSLPYAGEVTWLLGGMILLAVGLLGARAADQF